MNFWKSVVKDSRITLVFRVFVYQNLVFMQNEQHVRNQHQKLHRLTHILPKNIVRQKLTRRGLQGKK
jgi:hypothetical protein